jgi:uncharacterized protein YhbP (UPF0306 family)
MNASQLVKKIIEDNIYFTIATFDGSKPWASTLYYCVDSSYNFYFLSEKTSRHCQNILKNGMVSATIFDSHQPEGEGNGLQFEGKAKEIPFENIEDALKHYSTKFLPLSKGFFKDNQHYAIYKIEVDHFYTLDPEQEDKDVRIEVFLN